VRRPVQNEKAQPIPRDKSEGEKFCRIEMRSRPSCISGGGRGRGRMMAQRGAGKARGAITHPAIGFMPDRGTVTANAGMT
jgi:hypothetical protein